jgi:diadenosine tetraphosphate (Ap4A) HIT family hydrolase
MDTPTRTWPQQWFDWRDGIDCPKCAQGRPDEDDWGSRYYEGEHADGYLQKEAMSRGYSVVVFRGRHVADLVDLTDEELAGYWYDVRAVGRLVYEVFAPCHLNYQALGNFLPHLHTHVIPRYPDDPKPGRPLPETLWDSAPVVPAAEHARQLAGLRAAAGR